METWCNSDHRHDNNILESLVFTVTQSIFLIIVVKTTISRFWGEKVASLDKGEDWFFYNSLKIHLTFAVIILLWTVNAEDIRSFSLLLPRCNIPKWNYALPECSFPNIYVEIKLLMFFKQRTPCRWGQSNSLSRTKENTLNLLGIENLMFYPSNSCYIDARKWGNKHCW